MATKAAKLSKFVPEDGMQVIVSGSVLSWLETASTRYATYMEPFGLGALYAALEKQKKSWKKKVSLKKIERLHLCSRKIGLVTSKRARDKRHCISRYKAVP